MKDEKACSICNGTGWVCESCGTVWDKGDGQPTCCGAGMPCECIIPKDSECSEEKDS